MTAGGTPSDAFEITITIWHWDLGQLLFDKLTAEPNKPVKNIDGFFGGPSHAPTALLEII